MVRFLADASLRNAIVRGCLRREPTMDFFRRIEQTSRAWDRILVTSDFKTMPSHFGIDALVLVWAASDADEWRDRIVETPQP